MINFKNMTLQSFPSTIFLPGLIRNEMLKYLKQAGIEYQLLNYNDPEIENYRNERIWAARNYKEAGYPYENPDSIEGLTTNIKPEELIQKSKLFFGPTIDPDYKKQREQQEEQTKEDQKNYTDQATEENPYIPIYHTA